MERHEATELLREVIGNGIAQLFLVSLKEDSYGKFDLILKGECDTEQLKNFLSKRNLVVNANNEKGYCVISKP